MDWNGSAAPYAFRCNSELDAAKGGSPFTGLPLDLVAQVGDDGLGGIQYYFNHFYTWEGPVNATSPVGGWLLTQTAGGAGDSALTVRDGVQFGVLRITTDAADNDRTQIQFKGSSFKYVVGKRLWCLARIALQDANDGEFGFGLIEESDTDMVNTFPTDGIFFEKTETATDLDFHARKDGASTEKTAYSGATLADDTFFICGFTVDVLGNITPWYNGAPMTSKIINAGDANIVDDEVLSLAIEIQTGAAATRYVDLDWLLVAQER